jgi:cell division septation protein DedD
MTVTDAAISTTEKTRLQQPVKQPAEGHWVINLASSPSQADAERFAAKARSRGIETRQQQVSVKGKHYWRVQTTGFSTAAEAQTYAGTVRETLGLKDVWITTR